MKLTMAKFPCGICQKPVTKKHRAVCCDICDEWIHISCNYLDKKTYKKLQTSDSNWFCIKCMKKEIPFNNIPNQDLLNTLNEKNITPISNKNSNITKSMIENLLKDSTESPINCSYYNESEFNCLKTPKNYFSLMHLNISSLSFHFEELQQLL